MHLKEIGNYLSSLKYIKLNLNLFNYYKHLYFIVDICKMISGRGLARKKYSPTNI